MIDITNNGKIHRKKKSVEKKKSKSVEKSVEKKSVEKKKSKSVEKKKSFNSIKQGQILIVKPDRFLYLREPDYILGIVVDNLTLYDYKTKRKIKLKDYDIGIIFDDGFIPIQTFLVLTENESVYQSKQINKKTYKHKYVKYPKKDKFRISIDKNMKISPSLLMAKVKMIDNKKKFIDLTIKYFYKREID